jgi:hypothetical protein
MSIALRDDGWPRLSREIRRSGAQAELSVP